MSAIDQLITYILSLTPDQLNDAVALLPKLNEEIAARKQRRQQKETAQTQ